jgi:hypothetical protein
MRHISGKNNARRPGAIVQALSGKSTDSLESPRNRHDLSDYLRVLIIPENQRRVKIAAVWMNNQRTVLGPATRCQIFSVSPQNEIDWLLPKRLRGKMEGCFAPAIHDG